MIPNLLTLGNLISGCLSIVLVLHDLPIAGLVCIAISLILDFLDGLVARALGVSSEIGIQLDSLADVISFGVAPGIMIFDLLYTESSSYPLAFTAFLIPAFGAYRLARFNVEQASTSHFSGLPIPAAAMYFCGLFWLNHSINCSTCQSPFSHPAFLLISVVLISILMVSRSPHFSFKMKSLSWKGNAYQWSYLIIVLASIPFLKTLTASFSIVLYIFMSLLWSSRTKPKSLDS